MEPRTAAVQVGPPNPATVGPPIYANVTHISFTPYDFRLTFSLFSGAPSSDGLVAEPPRTVAEVVIPAAWVEPFSDLLRAELERYVEEFGSATPGVEQSARHG